MPELPEVETYVQELKPLLSGRTVIHAQVSWPRTIALPDAAAFATQMAGQQFVRFGRRGKYMLLHLASGATLIVHLRMTGRLYLIAADASPAPHTHVVMHLDNEQQLVFQDARKFGRIWLTSDPSIVLAKLGPEPFDPAFTDEALAKALHGRSASVKALLLDQSIVAGVGNIYADESLFRARIHPARPGGSLRADEVRALRAAIQQVLGEGVANAGSSLGTSGLQNYSRPGGAPGGFQEKFNVFRRTGQPCPVCGATIERIVVAQRGTHFCPRCQPLEPGA
ncbi:MAG: bifunctional DNA-formamidopyrimidine glycosylase/DNA-(apurinic or apyrimidinic site) lyase [Caldilinea sp.]|uniref:bifunctional DNA-formamidopyrimidine glycosylase/DNA-(apurinic or apyrimidinic site) lyase n=1 Tax=Caldilinea sp. TaxID=2293560 RepID=UPI0030AFF87D